MRPAARIASRMKHGRGTQPARRRRPPGGKGIATEEEGPDEGAGPAREDEEQSDIVPGPVASARRPRPQRLLDQEGGEDAHPHGPGHGDVRPAPGVVDVVLRRRAQCGGQEQGPGPGYHHPHPVTRDRGGRHQGLKAGLRRLDAVGVDDDVRSRRRKPQQHRRQGHGGQAGPPLGRVDGRHQQDGRHDGELRHQQPGPTPPQPARQKGPGDMVDQRRPDELEGIAEGCPTKEGHRPPVHAGLAEPQRQGGKNQQQRNPG